MELTWPQVGQGRFFSNLDVRPGMGNESLRGVETKERQPKAYCTCWSLAMHRARTEPQCSGPRHPTVCSTPTGGGPWTSESILHLGFIFLIEKKGAMRMTASWLAVSLHIS